MPRSIRKLSETKTYHVMIRGNERKDIFLDDEDKRKFIDVLYKIKGYSLDGDRISSREHPLLLGNGAPNFSIYAYCLMDNHAHLLINEGTDEISRIMKRINTSYAYYFNKRYGRIGHLFQDRFKSQTIESDNQLLAVIRYIHNNPVKAKIVPDPSLYNWSSYNGYIRDECPGFKVLDKDMILEMFTTDKARARKMFSEFTKQKNEDNFIEYLNKDVGKVLVTQKDAEVFLAEFLNNEGLALEELAVRERVTVRNELIRELRSKSSLSIRQIAELVKVNRGVVERVRV